MWCVIPENKDKRGLSEKEMPAAMAASEGVFLDLEGGGGAEGAWGRWASR